MTTEQYTGLRPQKMSWEKPYSDNSGTQIAIRYDETRPSFDGDATLEVEYMSTCLRIPVNNLDWMIARLQKISAELARNPD